MLSSPVCSVVGHLQYQGRPSKACMHWQFPVVPTDSRGLLVWLMKARHMIMFFGCPPTAGSLALGMYSKGYLSCLEELLSMCSEMRDNFKTNKLFKLCMARQGVGLPPICDICRKESKQDISGGERRQSLGSELAMLELRQGVTYNAWHGTKLVVAGLKVYLWKCMHMSPSPQKRKLTKNHLAFTGHETTLGCSQ